MIKDGDLLHPIQNEEIKKVFLVYLSGLVKSDDFVKLFAIFEDDFFTFLNAFEGKTLKVPKASSLKKICEYSTIYAFIRSKSFTEDAYELAKVKFKRKRSHLVSIVDKVSRVFDKCDI